MNNFSFLKKIIEFVKKYFLKQFTLFWFLPAESAKKSATQEGALLVGLFGCDQNQCRAVLSVPAKRATK